jgi:ADP-heptose synthase, bifunctional sugar kinase/adenylyltransferase
MTNDYSDFLPQLRASNEQLLKRLDCFDRAQVLAIGDLTLDEFLTGQVERISREAPVLILRYENTRQLPGGGANAVYNLAKLGGKVKVAGLVGKDDQGKALCSIFEAAGIDTAGILIDSQRPTVTKTRISGHARQSVTQQIVRVDRKSDELPDLDLQLQLSDYIRQQIPTVDAVVCSDYGDGVLTNLAIESAVVPGKNNCRRSNKFAAIFRSAAVYSKLARSRASSRICYQKPSNFNASRTRFVELNSSSKNPDYSR